MLPDTGTGRHPFTLAWLGAAEASAIALVDDDRHLTYGELANAAADRCRELDLDDRSLVVLSGATSTELIITYLALVIGGHVPLLAGGHPARLADAWRPDATLTVGAGGIDVQRRRPNTTRVLHPDLALLLSTSGSTGSPKLVRLSHANVAANAASIVEFLRLSPDDRGITSLPLHYCYGLSVLHSHLAAGATLVVTTASVVDPCFATSMVDHGVTNLAGVPHSFELLERAGPDRINTPTLRLVTQAGGKMAADDLTRWRRRLAAWGAELYVMYGQTEATARMAYLPPDLAERHPAAIGRAIPGGRLVLRPVDGAPDGVGELVYRGPNVMLGYATGDRDLALGATLEELATGDLARFHAGDDVYEIVGRRSRFVKPFGLRVDLDAVEAALRRELHALGGSSSERDGWRGEVSVAGDDEHLVVLAPGAAAAAARAALHAVVDLPPAASTIVVDGAVPRTESGKVDHAAVLALRRRPPVPPAPPSPRSATSTPATDVLRTVLGRPDITPGSTFVSLGGDSLSYVECSIRLQEALGRVPPDWHVMSAGELDRAGRRTRVPRLDTTVLLRAVGICLIVSTHMFVWYFPGGAHLLLAVFGFNLARFQLPIEATVDRVRAGLRTAARTAVPVVVWVAGAMVLVGGYSVGTLLLVNNYLGPRDHQLGRWHFWFIEVFVHLTVLTTLLMAIPAVRRLERRHQYLFPLALLVVCLVVRDVGDVDNLRFRTHGVAWFFVLGWLVQRSGTLTQRLVTTTLCFLSVPGFFTRPERGWFIVAGLVLLVWVREVPFPKLAGRAAGVVAAASMWILITHFRVWPPLTRALPEGWAYVLTILVGVGTWAVVEQATRGVRRWQVQARSERVVLAPLP